MEPETWNLKRSAEMVTEARSRVVLYTRKGCHLCDVAKAELDGLHAAAKFQLDVVDIDLDHELRQKYNDEVPVIFINGKKAFKYRIDTKRFLRLLGS